MQDDERMEGLIDAALRSYADPGVTPEARVVLARVRERAAETRRKRWWWAVGLGAATGAVLLLGALLFLHGPRDTDIARAPQAPAVVHPGPAPLRIDGSGRRAQAAVLPGRIVARRKVTTPAEKPPPKLDVFPAVTPLSTQEQALVAFAQHGPPEVQRAVLEDQKHWDDPMIAARVQETPPEPEKQQDP